MSNDISTPFTKDQNKTKGRKGYGFWKYEKETIISPKNYGMFVNGSRKRKKKK